MLNKYLMNESMNDWSIIHYGLALNKQGQIIWLMEKGLILLSQLSVHPSCLLSGTLSSKTIGWVARVGWMLTNLLVGLVS